MKIETGVMVMKDGKAWGKSYEDGHLTSYGWINPEDAPIHNPEFCKKPEDVTYSGSYLIPELRTGKLVAVERRTEVIVKTYETNPASVTSDVERLVRLPFPKGCTIKNIRVGAGSRSNNVYASLYSPDGDLLISATLEYINDRLLEMGTAT